MQNSLISIIVPIYKVEKYLNQCIKSIVNQTYSNLQIILVDDGSPDSCPEICDKWKCLDDRIEVIHKSNGGLSDARNAGICIACGEYLGFVDGDDFIKEDMYEKLLYALEKYHADISCCGRYIYNAVSQKCQKKFVSDEIKVYSANKFMKEILRGRIVDEATWDKLYKRSLFENVQYPEGEINEDIVTIPKLLIKSKKIVHIGEPLYYYRVVLTGISKSPYSKKNSIVLNHIYYVEKIVKENFKNIEKEVNVFKGRYSYSHLYKLSLDKRIKQEFQNDYKEYIKIFKSVFLNVLFSDSFSVKEKLFSILIWIGLFEKVRKIKYLVYKGNENDT